MIQWYGVNHQDIRLDQICGTLFSYSFCKQGIALQLQMCNIAVLCSSLAYIREKAYDGQHSDQSMWTTYGGVVWIGIMTWSMNALNNAGHLDHQNRQFYIKCGPLMDMWSGKSISNYLDHLWSGGLEHDYHLVRITYGEVVRTTYSEVVCTVGFNPVWAGRKWLSPTWPTYIASCSLSAGNKIWLGNISLRLRQKL